MSNPNQNIDDAADEKPPIMGSWNKLYALVILAHALLITALYTFTRLMS